MIVARTGRDRRAGMDRRRRAARAPRAVCACAPAVGDERGDEGAGGVHGGSFGLLVREHPGRLFHSACISCNSALFRAARGWVSVSGGDDGVQGSRPVGGAPRRQGGGAPGGKPRAVLAVLLLHANQPVSAERLAVALWGEEAPAGAVRTVQVYVSRLRSALGEDELLTTSRAGYWLRVRAGELDLERFERLVEEGRRALAQARAEEAAGAAARGAGAVARAAAGRPGVRAVRAAEIARLEEQRLAALEARVEADLAAGRHAELVGELQRLVGEHPLRERLHGQLMLALYRVGRQADALEAYRRLRHVLLSEIGVEPGAEARRVHEAMLRQDAELEPPRPRGLGIALLRARPPATNLPA